MPPEWATALSRRAWRDGGDAAAGAENCKTTPVGMDGWAAQSPERLRATASPGGATARSSWQCNCTDSR